MKTASEDEIIKTFYQQNTPMRFSRIPVYKDNADNITGFVLRVEMMDAIINDEGQKDLSSLKREMLITNAIIQYRRCLKNS